MDISLLKTFLEVARTRNFSRAAENLFVTSAAVSARVKLLENHFGVTLFVRNRGHMLVTAEAERLIPLAESMLGTWNRALNEIGLHPEMDMKVHIGATPSLWVMAMQEKLANIRAALPDVGFQAEAHASETLVRSLEEGRLDLVLLPDPFPGEEITSTRIGELTLVLCSNRHCNYEDALSENYIFVDWGTAFNEFHARKIGDRAKPILQVNLSSIAQAMLESNHGSAYLPQSVVAAAKHLHEVPAAPVFKRPIYVCYRNQNLGLVQQIAIMLQDIRL